ncbi:MAG: undecaprenyl-diphosphate phosphatase [Planctomycetota bacterium]|nr:undecaprenyl-diphosphate phosphatase [Planctomycetota bacterium]
MTLLDAIILGVIQGVTEFLPVSSSGHLVLIRKLRGGENFSEDIAFDVVLHLATLLAVCIAFRGALWKVLKEDRRSILLLGLSTSFLGLALIPVGGGRKLKDVVSLAREEPALLAGGFLFTAFLLSLMTWLQRRSAKASQEPAADGGEDAKDENEGKKGEFSIVDSLVIGFLQLIAIMPGVSRSGSTIVGGMLRGGTTNLAFDYAFLLSIPAILGAVVVEGKDIVKLTQVQPLPLIVGFIAALLTGLASIALLRWLLSRDRFWLFIPYLLLCAGLALSL